MGLPFTGVTIDQGATASLASGNTLNLTYTLSDEGTSGVTAVWSASSDKVTVTNNGVVTPVKNGTVTVTITATKGETVFTDSIEITVTGIAEFTGLTADVTKITLKIGETKNVVITPNGTNLPAVISYIYLTGDGTVAEISNGTITAIGVGETVVTIKTTLSGVTKEVTVAVTVTSGEEKPSGGCTGSTAALTSISLLILAVGSLFFKKKSV